MVRAFRRQNLPESGEFVHSYAAFADSTAQETKGITNSQYRGAPLKSPRAQLKLATWAGMRRARRGRNYQRRKRNRQSHRFADPHIWIIR
jgi:hypothetical protein